MSDLTRKDNFNTLENPIEKTNYDLESKKGENFSSTKDLKEYLQYKYGQFGMSLFP